jgi:hypothetical protein
MATLRTSWKMQRIFLPPRSVLVAAAGTLQQAVLTECIASEFMAVPLLFMTRAHATCNWALVLSLSVAGVSVMRSSRWSLHTGIV